MLRRVGASLGMLLLVEACGPAAPTTEAPRPTPTPPPAAARAPTSLPTLAPTATQPPPTVAPSPTARARPPLQQALADVLARQTGTVGVVVKPLAGSQATVSLNADGRFRSASLYKLFVMQTAASRIDAGDLDRAEVLTLTPALVADDPYSDLPVGTRTTVDCALQTMLEMSGNSAADLLVDRLGMDAINQQMASLGLTQSVITDETAFTSPADVARLLDGFATRAAGGAKTEAGLLDMLSAQQHDDGLVAPLPLGVRVAHKTGELPNLRNEAGIVYASSGAYIFAAMAQDANSEQAAQAAIVELSRAAYDALDPVGLTTYRGLPPSLARQVFAAPDARGRLLLPGDPRTDTVPLVAAGIDVQPGPNVVRLRPEVVPDLLAMQAEARDAGTPFSARDGLRAPTDAQAAQAQPAAWITPCPVQLPNGATGGVRYGQPAAPDSRPGLAQQWLGTTVVVGDASVPEAGDGTAQWLLAHAAEYGFVPAPPETATGEALGHEPWTYRWLGRDLAADLSARHISGPAVVSELARLEADLTAQASPADPLRTLLAAPDSQAAVPCWATPDSTTQGCPSRFYFAPSDAAS